MYITIKREQREQDNNYVNYIEFSENNEVCNRIEIDNIQILRLLKQIHNDTNDEYIERMIINRDNNNMCDINGDNYSWSDYDGISIHPI